MRIGSAEDAESVVRKYFLGTRTSHGKIVSMSAEEKSEGPDDSGTWKVKGAYLRGRRESRIRSYCHLRRRSADNQFKFKQAKNATRQKQGGA
jgi:hypothetical protein